MLDLCNVAHLYLKTNRLLVENGQCVNHRLSFVQEGICLICPCREDLYLFLAFCHFYLEEGRWRTGKDREREVDQEQEVPT